MIMSSSPSLQDIQIWMKSILTDPRGASDAVAKSDKWINFVNSDKTSNIERLDIYAEAYFGRILEAFTIDYPITAFVLGEEQLAKLVAEYLKGHPSVESNLNNISKSIIPFINSYSNSKIIQDIVTLERLALESFYSPIVSELDPQSLASLKESDWEIVKFNLNDSLKFIESSWPLEEIWNKRHSLENVVIKEESTSGYYIIERISHHIKISKISETQFFILNKLSQGFPLSSFNESDLKNTNEDISTLFSSWIQKSYFKNYYL